jgi:hypothetical protein
MDKHIQLVGILNLVYRGLGIIGAVILLVMGAWFNHFIRSIIEYESASSYDVPPQFVFDLVSVAILVIALTVFVVSIAGVIGAIGVLQRKEWGRIVLLVVSFFNLLHVPIGTVLGIYSIWVLMKDETVRLFKPPVVTGQDVPSPPSGG